MSCGQPTFRTQRPDQTARVSWLPAGRRRKETGPPGQSESERKRAKANLAPGDRLELVRKSWMDTKRNQARKASQAETSQANPSQTRPKPKPSQGGIRAEYTDGTRVQRMLRIGWGAYSSPLLIGYWGYWEWGSAPCPMPPLPA